MARPKSTGELKGERIVTMMSASELAALDDWCFKNRIRSRGEAIRKLVRSGIEAPVATGFAPRPAFPWEKVA